ncbi:lipoate--protein ligase [Hutsoniella sourekii]
MILIEMKRNGEKVFRPGVDMAVQEYVRQHLFFDEDIMMPYTTSPQVQMGRYQNVAKEVNRSFMEEAGIQLCRRDTGGGAIYLDRGNTSFCYLFNKDSLNTVLNFQKLYQPVIEVLHDLGAKEVEMKGRNDLTINGKKISGAAMSHDPERIYAGYSLQLDIDIESMMGALTTNRKKISAKGIDSVRSRVESIRPHLAPEYQDISASDFHDLVACKLLGVDDLSQAKRYELTDDDWAIIDQRCQEKWLNWDWVYGHSPKYEYSRDTRIEGVGTIEVYLTVDSGKISDLSIYGDFFGSQPIEEFEQILIGVGEDRQALLQALEEVDLKPYFNADIRQELVDLIVS